jgi:pimeloyl-ACP methyl ester carboxylesterase
VQAADLRLFVQEAGPPNGPAVVFVHGPGAWSEIWRQPMTELGRLGYHAIALDLPPFGFSQRPDPPTYYKRRQVLRIFGLLDALHIDKAVMVGHSFGAAPVVEAAIVAPQRVSGLLLVDAVLEIRPKEQREQPTRLAQFADYLAEHPVEREWLVSCFLTNPLLTQRLLQLAVADPASAKQSWVSQLQAPLGIRGTTVAVDDWLASQLIKSRPGFGEFQFAYPWLKLPIVLIWGREDPVAPVEDAELIHSLAPQSRLVVFDKVGHFPQIEEPEAFSQQVAEAIKTLSPLRAPHGR